jgi:ATP-dependent DNA helicase RecQ
MKDQVDGLPPALRVQALALNSLLDGDELRTALHRVATGQIKLLYAAPERLRQVSFVEMLARAGVARLVIDEAHCVSVWGHDFRPDYLHLRQVHRDLGAPPLLAMTATAPPVVRADIERQLLGGAGAMRVLAGDTFRANLHLRAYRVRDDDARQRAAAAAAALGAGQRDRLCAVAAALRGAGGDLAAGRLCRRSLSRRHRQSRRGAGSLHAQRSARDRGDHRLWHGHRQGRHPLHRTRRAARVAGGLLPGDRPRRARRQARALSAHLRRPRRGHAGAAGAAFGAHQRSAAHTLPARAPALGRPHRRPGAAPVDAGSDGRRDHRARRAERAGEVGLLRRGYDCPRTVTLQRPRQLRGQDDAGFMAFARRSGLDGQQVVTAPFIALAEATGLTPAELEQWLLVWQEARYLAARYDGRDPYLEVLPPPAQVAERLEQLLRNRAALDQQRAGDIARYARTTACRHGFLADYLGGERRTRCPMCDNCGAAFALASDPAAHAADADLLVLLQALQEQNWGRRNLVRLLRGDPEASTRAQESSFYGALRTRSERGLEQMLASVQADGLVQTRDLEHGGVVLELTRRGVKQMQDLQRAGRR